MKTQKILTDIEYNNALKRLDEIFFAPKYSPEAIEAAELSALIEEYEESIDEEE